MLIRTVCLIVVLGWIAIPARGQGAIDFRSAARSLQGALLIVDDGPSDETTPPAVPAPIPMPWQPRPDLRWIPNPSLGWEPPARLPQLAVAVDKNLVLAMRIRRDEVTLRDADDQSWQGRVVARDQLTGLVAIRIDDAKLSPLAIAEEEPDPGLPVLMGWRRDANTIALESSMIASGPISDPPQFGISQLIHVSSAPLHLGAPIVDHEGFLVGLLLGQGAETRCLSVWHLSKLIRAAEGPELTLLQRGRIGIQIESSDQGPRVGGVMNESPAQQAGVQVGDQILAVNGRKCRSATDVMAAVAMSRAGDEISLTLQRGDATEEVAVTLNAAPEPSAAPDVETAPAAPYPIPQMFRFQGGRWIPVIPSGQELAPDEPSADEPSADEPSADESTEPRVDE